MSAPEPNPRVVALGGGHGLSASLAALRRVTDRVTAVVTVADNGGSSGRIRDELGAIPPGDLRMALCALLDAQWTDALWSRVLQHRFRGDGPLAGHAVGNILLAGLMEVVGNPSNALLALTSGLDIAGQVLPMADEGLDIVAEVSGLDPADPDRLLEVRGQHEVASTHGRVHSVRLLPESARACTSAVAAVREADWVVLGPGSLFTSMLPHLLLPDLRDAIVHSAARRLLVLNLAAQPGETEGFSPEAHLEVLAKHAPDLRLDSVLADASRVLDSRGLISAAEAMGAQLVLADVAAPGDGHRHDPELLARALREVFSTS